MWGGRVIIPAVSQGAELHKERLGISKMEVFARRHVWWSGMDRELDTSKVLCQMCSCQAITSEGTSPSLDLAQLTMAKDSHWICRSIPGQVIADHRQCLFEVGWSDHHATNYHNLKYCSTTTVAFSLWSPGGDSIRQWVPIHLCWVYWVHQEKWD